MAARKSPAIGNLTTYYELCVNRHEGAVSSRRLHSEKCASASEPATI